MNPEIPTDFGDSVEFIFNDYDPIQTGVVSGTIDLDRVAVLRGKVLQRGGAALSGATVSILNHPEFGQTLSRADGMFDLAVNGGGSIVVSYRKDGYLQSQRQIDTVWQDFAWLPDIVLIQTDSHSTAINLASLTQVTEARGSVVSDDDGTRQATLLFQPGTTASMELPGGITRTLSTLTVRASEYTVGDDGPLSMPAALPSNSGYTYAAEFSVDEAMAAGATNVRFTKPVIFHLDNFLGFPVGGVVPVGYYDRASGTWVPADNGLVIKILSISGGRANLDIDGSGNPASPAALTALGVTDAERAKLATLYTAGKSLWRVPVDHFTPFDCNWPLGPPPDAVTPPPSDPTPTPDKCDCDDPCCDKQQASFSEQENSQNLDLAGSGVSLSYNSGSTAGNFHIDTSQVIVTGPRLFVLGPQATAPINIRLQIQVAGQQFLRTFPVQPNQSYEFTWNGKDAYGRKLQGAQRVSSTVCYDYRTVYLSPAELQRAFAQFSTSGTTLSGNAARSVVSLCRQSFSQVGGFDAASQGNGGWNPEQHHVYDPRTGTIYQGDGTARKGYASVRDIGAPTSGLVISSTVNGPNGYGFGIGVPATTTHIDSPAGLVQSPDGTVYYADQENNWVWRIEYDRGRGEFGNIYLVAGSGSNRFYGDGGPATNSGMDAPDGLALGPDGSLYIADVGHDRIRRVSPAGIISTVAGNGGTCDYRRDGCGDGGQATAAQLLQPRAVAVAADGSIYIADTGHNVIRRIAANGVITRVAGTPCTFFGGCIGGDGGPAVDAGLGMPTGLAFGPDGSFYIAESSSGVIHRVGRNGIINVVAGVYTYGTCQYEPAECYSGDGGPATQAAMNQPSKVAVGSHGELYIADSGNGRIRMVDTRGIISTIAGNGAVCSTSRCGDGGAATTAQLEGPSEVILGVFGDLIVSDLGNKRIRSFRLGGAIQTIGGNGTNCYAACGDGEPAIAAGVRADGLATGPDGSLYIADSLHHRIRRVGPDGIITTVAGNGNNGFSGDGGPATEARLNEPQGVAIGPDGSIYIADTWNSRIRRVAPDGRITTIAGCGDFRVCFNSDDGVPAVQAQIERVQAIAVGPDGSVYLADYGRVRKVSPDGVINTVAGGISSCRPDEACGDGGPASRAGLGFVRGLAVGPDDKLYIAEDDRVRRVDADGRISRVAGIGSEGFSGDGGAATRAQLGFPSAIAVGAEGVVYIADYLNKRIRAVTPGGIIFTVAGDGTACYPSTYPWPPVELRCGDGGPALRAGIAYPTSLALAPDGSFYVGGSTVRRVRQALPAGSNGISSLATAEIIYPSADGTEVFIFAQNGRHLRTVNALTGALQWQFGYDSAGLLISMTDGYGNVTRIERDGNGKVTGVLAPNGQRALMSLDANGYLAATTNPAGETTRYTYTSDGLMTSLTDPRGNVYRYFYDGKGRMIRQELPNGGALTFSRVEAAGIYTVTQKTALSRTLTLIQDFSASGIQHSVNIGPDGARSESWIYPDATKVFSSANGTIITGTLVPDPRWGMAAPFEKVLSQTLPGGLTATIVSTRTVGLADPGDLLSLLVFSSTQSINGRISTTVYSATAHTLTSISPEGRRTTTTLDDHDKAVKIEVSGLLPTMMNYDPQGRLIGFSQGNRVSRLAYDAQWHIASITDALSRMVRFEYDAAGRVSRQILPDGREVNFIYDGNGNTSAISPPGRPDHRFTYTSMNQPEDYSPPAAGPGSGPTHNSYNTDLQLTSIRRPDAATTVLSYDTAGRPRLITHPDGNIAFSYDPTSGQLSTISGPNGSNIAYEYDGDLLKAVKWSGVVTGSVELGYDNSFRVLSETVSGANSIGYQYDRDNLLRSAGAISLRYNQQNSLLASTMLGGVADSFSYNAFGENTAYQATYAQTNLLGEQYTRDNLGRIAQRIETVAGVTHTYGYNYDLVGRLSEVTKDGASLSTYGYDANGNRTAYSGPNGSGNGSYDDQDRLLQYGNNTYSYTANGELRSKTAGGQTTTYRYDLLGNLVAVTMPNGSRIEYLVDGNNRRIGKKVNGVLVQGFLYHDALNPVAELDGNGNLVARFVYASRNNPPDYMIKGGVTYRIIADHLGSPRLVVNATNGQVAQRLDYDEFGSILADSNPGFQPFGFAGGIYDQHTKLLHFGERDYDPQAGRWTAKDPIGFSGSPSNLYEYVMNDPVNSRDSNGLGVVKIRNDTMVMETQYWADRSVDPNNSAVETALYTAAGVFTTLLTPEVQPYTELALNVFVCMASSGGGGPRNQPETIGGRPYSGHALDRMEERGLVPSVVEDTIARGAQSAGRDGAVVHTTEQAKVVVNPSNGKVITVMKK